MAYFSRKYKVALNRREFTTDSASKVFKLLRSVSAEGVSKDDIALHDTVLQPEIDRLDERLARLDK